MSAAQIATLAYPSYFFDPEADAECGEFTRYFLIILRLYGNFLISFILYIIYIIYILLDIEKYIIIFLFLFLFRTFLRIVYRVFPN